MMRLQWILTVRLKKERKYNFGELIDMFVCATYPLI